MKRLLLSTLALSLIAGQAYASSGFSCEADDKNVTKLAVEGATPRSGGNLINFGGILEFDDKKLEFKQSDVQRYFGEGGIIQVRMSLRSGDQVYTVRVNAKRNPKDEDDWGGTYEVSYGPAMAAKDKSKAKPQIKRGKVKCFVE